MLIEDVIHCHEVYYSFKFSFEILMLCFDLFLCFTLCYHHCALICFLKFLLIMYYVIAYFVEVIFVFTVSSALFCIYTST